MQRRWVVKKRSWRGQSMVEYALLLCLIGLVALSVMRVMGKRSQDTFTTVNDHLVTMTVAAAPGVAPAPPPAPADNPPPPDYGDADDWYEFYRGRGPVPGHPGSPYGPDLGHDYAKDRALQERAGELAGQGKSPGEIADAMGEFGDHLDGLR